MVASGMSSLASCAHEEAVFACCANAATLAAINRSPATDMPFATLQREAFRMIQLRGNQIDSILVLLSAQDG
jgi:hypothetical protein